MMFVLLFVTSISMNVHAANANVRVGEALNYPNGFPYMTHYFYMNDTLCYCLQPRFTPMAEGAYETVELGSEGDNGYPLLIRVLACGYGGPNDLTGVYFPNASEQERYVYTHIAAGYAYMSNSEMGSRIYDTTGLTEEQFEACGLGDFIRAAWQSGYDGTVCVVQVNGYQDIGYLASYKEPGWTLKIKKTDVETGDLLSGAVYGVYSDPECTKLITKLSKTDKKGKSDCRVDNKYSKVYVKEIKAPKGYVLDENVYEVNKDDGVTVDVRNLRYKVKLRLEKTDSETANTILNTSDKKAVFDIYESDTQTLAAENITIEEDGFGYTDFVIPSGKYDIVEKNSPKGYVKRTQNVTLEFYDDTDVVTDDKTGEKVLPIAIDNSPIKGKIKIYKEGEQLVNVIAGDETSGKNAKFEYGKKPIEGVEFEIHAKNDIYNPDGCKDASGKRNIKYAKDELIAVIKTDSNGEAYYDDDAKPLYIGDYYVIEKNIPDGFAKNNKKYNFTIDDSAEDINYEAKLDIENIRQKYEIKITKTDIKREKFLSGAMFSIYAAEDIKGYDGTVLVKKDTFLGSAKSGSNGKCEFNLDLKKGRYYVKETKAPEGYIKSGDSKIVYLNSSRGETVIECVLEFANEKTEEEDSEIKGKIVMGATKTKVVKTNYKTDDNGEYGYSILLKKDDSKYEISTKKILSGAALILVNVLIIFSSVIKSKKNSK